jgi:hypothetical protein
MKNIKTIEEISIIINNYEPIIDEEDDWSLFYYLYLKELINDKSDK